MSVLVFICFFFQAEDGIRDLVRSRGLGDVYKRQLLILGVSENNINLLKEIDADESDLINQTSTNQNQSFADLFKKYLPKCCLLYTSDAADERSSVDLGGRRIIKKKTYSIKEHQ